jgi:Tol biopolymer transport system component
MKMMNPIVVAVLLFVGTVLSQTSVPSIVPGENLVVEGVPRIPASLADEVGRYTDFRSATLASWHPVRREIDIYIVNPADARESRMLLQVNSGGWAAIDWSTDDKKLLVIEYVSANESYLWLADSSTGEKTLVTPKGGEEKVSYNDAKFSKDGRAFTSLQTKIRSSSVSLTSTSRRSNILI